MMSVDLLLIHPGNKRAYNTLSCDLPAIEPPIWAGMLATYADVKGLATYIYDENICQDSVIDVIKNLRPNVVAVVASGHNPSASTQSMPRVIEICKEIKASDIGGFVAIVGGHISALPELSLKQTGADIAVVGEGFDALVSLAHGHVSWASIPGIVYWDRSNYVFTQPAPLIKNIPGVPFGRMDLNKYRAHNWHTFGYNSRSPYAAIYTSLGCPFDCSYCCVQAPFRAGDALAGKDKSYRLISLDTIITQITELVEHQGVKHLKIADELFLFNKQHVRDVCNFIIDRQYDLNIWAYARLDNLDILLLDLMRKAGVRWLGVGVESADDGKVAKINIPEKINTIRDRGIYVAANYMIGLPNDSMESIIRTSHLAQELNTEWANFNFCLPFPGSRLWNEQKSPSTDWAEYSFYGERSKPMGTTYLSSEQVKNTRNQVFREYFDRDAYRLMLRRTFGQGAVDEVERMLR